MKEKTKRALLYRRALAISLALVMCVTFIPLFNGNAYAAQAAPQTDAQTNAQTDEITVEEMEDIDLGEVDPGEVELAAAEAAESDEIAEDALPAPDPEAVQEAMPALSPEALQDALAQTGQEPLFESAAELGPSDAAGGITLSQNRSNGELTVTGTVSGDTFNGLGIYDSSFNKLAAGAESGATFTEVLDMSMLDVGAYYIVATTAGGRTYVDVAIAEFYDIPANKQSQYETYSKYMFYTAPSTYYRSDYNSGLYLDVRAKGKTKWTTYGPLESSSTIKKLKPNKFYQVRAFYGKVVTIGDQTFFLSGRDNKKYKTVTVKTGKKSLPIKSVRAKAVKVRKYTHKRYGPATGLYLGQETWYTYRIKVTVKMKKKPGVKGIYINGKKVKGNKKSYSKTFSRVSSLMYGVHKVRHYKGKWWKQDDYYNIPRGKKYTAAIYSYSHKTYKAYSPIQKRKTRLK